MSSPMSRSISRPFGRAAAQPADVPASEHLSMPSVTDFVLQDTAGDTPHDIHPHAAAYASRSSNPMDQAPMRISTGSAHNAPTRPKPATAEERAAYIRMRNAQMQAAQAPAAPPAQVPDQYSPPVATYALTAHDVNPGFRIPATATYDAAPAPAPAPTQPLPATPANPGATEALASAFSADSGDPAPRPASAALSQLGSPLQLNPPKRVSSLAASVHTAQPTAPRPPELEIAYTSANGRTVTVRLFAP